jgi:hypothetical protein
MAVLAEVLPEVFSGRYLNPGKKFHGMGNLGVAICYDEIL